MWLLVVSQLEEVEEEEEVSGGCELRLGSASGRGRKGSAAAGEMVSVAG